MPVKINSLYFTALVASIFYWALLAVVPSETMNDLLDGALIANCAVVTWKYSLRGKLKYAAVADSAETIRVGIVLGWASCGIWRLERFFIQIHAFGLQQSVGVHDPLRGYMIMVGVIATSYHILSLHMVKPGYPATHVIMLTIASIAVGVLGVVPFIA